MIQKCMSTTEQKIDFYVGRDASLQNLGRLQVLPKCTSQILDVFMSVMSKIKY